MKHIVRFGYLVVAFVTVSLTLSPKDALLVIAIPDEPPPIANTPDWKFYQKTEMRRRESLEFMPYMDVNKWAVGYGYRISAKEAERIRRQGGITEAYADSLTESYHKVLRALILKEAPNLTENQIIAAVDLAYGTGFEGLKSKPLWKRIKKGDTSQQTFNLWTKTAAKYSNNARSRIQQAHLWRAHQFPESMAALNTITAVSLKELSWRKTP